MLRLHFTGEDLLRIAFADRPAPLMELGMALASLQRTDLPGAFSPWQRNTRRVLPPSAFPLLELIQASGRGPVFLDPLSPGLDEGIDLVRAASPGFVREDLRRVFADASPSAWARGLAAQDPDAWAVLRHAIHTAHDSILKPQWGRVRSCFDAEHAWRTRLMAGRGLRATLVGLAPGARWVGTTLEFDAPFEVDVPLEGRGLTLLPSVFWRGSPLATAFPGHPPVLIYPSMTPLPLVEEEPSTGDALTALLGRSRAAALEALTRELTTSALAREIGVGKSSASEHAKALREARLITTVREGKSALHSCTSLGVELLTASRLAGKSLL